MLKRSLFFIVAISYSLLVHATNTPLDLELGTSTLVHIIKAGEIIRIGVNDKGEAVEYCLHPDSINMKNVEHICVWCGGDEHTVQGLAFTMPISELDEVVKSIASQFKSIDAEPIDLRLKCGAPIHFRDGNTLIIVCGYEDLSTMLVSYRIDNMRFDPTKTKLTKERLNSCTESLQ